MGKCGDCGEEINTISKKRRFCDNCLLIRKRISREKYRIKAKERKVRNISVSKKNGIPENFVKEFTNWNESALYC